MIHTHGQDAFLVKFVHDHALTICEPKELKQACKEHDPENRGIDYIKRFHPSKGKFMRVKKSTILMLINWNTEVYLFMKTQSYFN